MKTSTAVVLFGIQFLFFAVICGGVFVMGEVRVAKAKARSAAAETRAAEIEVRAVSAEKQNETLKEDVAEQKKFNHERMAEIGRMKERVSDLDKQIATMKTEPRKRAMDGQVAGPNRIIIGTELPGFPQGGGALQEMLKEQLLKQLGNIQITPNGLGISGAITIEGKTLKFGDQNVIDGEKEQVNELLNELEKADETKRDGKKNKTEKGEQF